MAYARRGRRRHTTRHGEEGEPDTGRPRRAPQVAAGRSRRGPGLHARERRRARRPRCRLPVPAVVLLSPFGIAGSGGAATAYDDEELKFAGLINDYREQNGLRPVIASDTPADPRERHPTDLPRDATL